MSSSLDYPTNQYSPYGGAVGERLRRAAEIAQSNNKLVSTAIPAPPLPQPAFAAPEQEARVYFVWREFGGSTPTVKHSTLASAEKEADRLARLSPGYKFYVLSSLESVTVPKATATWRSAAAS